MVHLRRIIIVGVRCLSLELFIGMGHGRLGRMFASRKQQWVHFLIVFFPVIIMVLGWSRLEGKSNGSLVSDGRNIVGTVPCRSSRSREFLAPTRFRHNPNLVVVVVVVVVVGQRIMQRVMKGMTVGTAVTLHPGGTLM